MELRKAAPVVNDLVAEFMVIMLREYCKKEAVSAEEIESRARRMCEYYSICLACNKLKRHNQFVPRDGVLLSRRAEKRGIPGSYTLEEWIALCERFDYRCVCCGKKDPLEADHVIAMVRVDCTNDIGNIQPLCKSCNSSKGRDSIDYRQTPFTWSGIEIRSSLRTLRKGVPEPTLDGW